LSNFNGSDDAFFEVVEAAWQKFGRPPKQAEIRRPEYAVGGTSISRHFGSWRRALESFVEQANGSDPQKVGGDIENPDSNAVAPMLSTPLRASRNIGWRLRFLVLRRDGFRCVLCGASPALTPGVRLQVDHIEPWAGGGETALENLQSTCERCNGGKSSLPLTPV